MAGFGKVEALLSYPVPLATMGFGVVQNLNREKVSLKVFRSFTVSYSVHASCPPSSSITPKTSAKFSSLNSSIARARRHRRERKAPRAILELSDAKFAEVFGVILMFQNQGFLPQNLRFEL